MVKRFLSAKNPSNIKTRPSQPSFFQEALLKIIFQIKELVFGDIRYHMIFIDISTKISLSNIGNQISIFRYFTFRGTERQASNQKQCANRKLVSYTIPICNFIHSVGQLVARSKDQ